MTSTTTRQGWRRWVADVTPLRANRDFRRLWAGLTLATIGQSVAVTAIGLQVYDITGSTWSVGLVGLVGLVPLLALGLYGGSVVDAHDRRTVAVVASTALWVLSMATAAQAWLGANSVLLLYALVALQSAAYAVNNPARQAIVPSLVSRELLPAANALTNLSWMIGFAAGPMLCGWLVHAFGFEAAYTLDAVTYAAAVYGVVRLPPMPPAPGAGPAGLRSVLTGLAFLRTRPNVRMTFMVDLCAMVLAMPKALFPALGMLAFGGGAATVGLLSAAIAIGSVGASLLSGPLGHVRRQGLAVLVCVVAWGGAVAVFGLTAVGAAGGVGGLRPVVDGVPGMGWMVWPACAALLVAGAADAVSATFRTTILQAATPEQLRGRLQGVFFVVVAGGPRLGDVAAGGAAGLAGEPWTAVLGGAACIVAVVVLAACWPGFARYDARDPRP
ncbi:MAG: MFS transporter [Kineosporiaceae bacterium]